MGRWFAWGVFGLMRRYGGQHDGRSLLDSCVRAITSNGLSVSTSWRQLVNGRPGSKRTGESNWQKCSNLAVLTRQVGLAGSVVLGCRLDSERILMGDCFLPLCLRREVTRALYRQSEIHCTSTRHQWSTRRVREQGYPPSRGTEQRPSILSVRPERRGQEYLGRTRAP